MKKFGRILITVAALVASVAFATPNSAVSASADGVALDYKHFPDYSFRYAIGNKADTNHNNYLESSEIAAFKNLYLSNITWVSKDMGGFKAKVDSGSTANYMSLKGIEYLTGLETIDVTGITDVDLDLYSNKSLKKITLAQCPNLEYLKTPSSATSLYVAKAQNLSSLDISQSSSLTSLEMMQTGVRRLDLSNCSNLKTLSFIDMPIKKLEISNLSKLTKLVMMDTNIKSVKLYKGSRVDKLSKMKVNRYVDGIFFSDAYIDGEYTVLNRDIGIIFE